jgi:hypothetical protein
MKYVSCNKAGFMSRSCESTYVTYETLKRDSYISYIWRCIDVIIYKLHERSQKNLLFEALAPSLTSASPSFLHSLCSNASHSSFASIHLSWMYLTSFRSPFISSTVLENSAYMFAHIEGGPAMSLIVPGDAFEERGGT